MIDPRKLSARIAMAVLCVCTTLRCAAGQSPSATSDITPLTISWAAVQGINQPVLPEQGGVNVTYRVDGREVNGFLSVDSDTSLWKGGDIPNPGAPALILRDGRFSQALLRLDVGHIPRGAEILRATLRFRVEGVERKGETGSFKCYRVLTPWSKDATWVRPEPSTAVAWNGLQAGKDFEPKELGKTGPLDVGDLQKTHHYVEIPGLEDAVRRWHDGTWPNNGLLLTFEGKAIQLSIPSSEATREARVLTVGGAGDGKVFLIPDLPLLGRILLKTDDLEAAQPSISAGSIAVSNKDGILKIYETDDAGKTVGSLLSSVPLSGMSAGRIVLPNIAPVLRTWLDSGQKKKGLLLTAEGTAAGVTFTGVNSPHRPALDLQVRNHRAEDIFGPPSIRPLPGVYAKVVNGHITYNGQRLRLWGVVGYPQVERLAELGFNAERLWAPNAVDCYTPESAARGEFLTYEKGDDSKFDLADKHFADLKSHGMFVMFAALTGTVPVEHVVKDGSFIQGGNDWEEWKVAVTVKDAPLNQLTFVDERLQQMRRQHAKNLLTHVNPYTGKCYGEDEAIALYEVFNENAFLERTLTNGGLEKWPPYFKQKLQRRWNEWLGQHYADDAGLLKAWGSVKPGESLKAGTVEPAPAFEARIGYSEKRANDFVEFMVGLEDRFDQEFRAYCRSLFPAGVGVNVAGFSFDTFYRPNLPWAFTQSLGDIHCHGMYFWAVPSTLDKPPSAYVLDSFTPANMPTVVYETNSARPSPYRAEYPVKLAALASRQDWDGVFFHYWQHIGEGGSLAYLTGAMDYPHTSFYWTGVEHQTDPVMATAMALGGRIFLGQKIPPAETPEIFKAGKKALFSYANFRGINTALASFSKGSRILYSPGDDSGITVDGKPAPQTGRIAEALAAGQYVTWDWPNGRLIIDAPTVKVYVGKVSGPFCFSDGIVLRDVSTPWISFALVSADERPLTGPNATGRAYMGGVFDAKNTGFLFDYRAQGGPVEQAKKIVSYGRAPILEDRVNYKLSFPNNLHGTVTSYDFALRQTNVLKIADGNQVPQEGSTPFMNVVDIAAWGDKSSAPTDLPTIIAREDYASLVGGTTDNGGKAGNAVSGALFPVSGMNWTTNLDDAQTALRDSPLIFTSLGKPDTSRTLESSFLVTDAQLPLLWNSLADVMFTFQQNRLAKVEVTFKQPPSVAEVIDVFTKALGEPVQKKLDTQYGVTEIHWSTHAQLPDVFVTESQGVMKVIYQPPAALH